jgi:hypothetical protein
VNLASRGLRDLDSGAEPITDPDELAQVRRQARRVYLKGLAAGVLLTALSFAIPR